MDLNGKRILLTGAEGFVGRHLADALRKRNATVLPLSDERGNFVDVRHWDSVEAAASRLVPVDMVYHLAALMFVPLSFEHPREIYDVNVLGTLNVLELCRIRRVSKFIFASSYVYGRPQYLPVDEGHPLQPASPYARSKVLAESLCEAYSIDHGLDCLMMRFFNLYGEGQSEDFLIPSILRQLASGIVKLKDPEPRRDYLYIDDAVDAYVRAGEYEGTGFEIFNLGFGRSYAVDDIARRVSRAWGLEVKITYEHERRREEIMDVVADITKARRLLGWHPKVDFDEGLSRYVDWYRSRHDAGI